jgi:hypothetical protein
VLPSSAGGRRNGFRRSASLRLGGLGPALSGTPAISAALVISRSLCRSNAPTHDIRADTQLIIGWFIRAEQKRWPSVDM